MARQRSHRCLLAGFCISFALAGAIGPASAQSNPNAACLVGLHAGIPASDAATAASLTCDELRQHGVSVGNPRLAPRNLMVNIYGRPHPFDDLPMK